MPSMSDMELAREYARRNSESAFAELVNRHVNLVYSVAFRYVHNVQDAQDIAQAVFLILARKAVKLCDRISLTSWLYETTRLTAICFLRTKTRRATCEQEASMEHYMNQTENDGVWQQLMPLLEEAMARLTPKERELMALRFFEKRSGAETAALLGIGEAAAHKRTERAVEKLRLFFARRGIGVSAASLIGAVSVNSVHAAPAGLAKTISAVAMAKSATAGGSTLTLVKGILKIMAWSKVKTTIVVGVGILLAAGTTTVAMKEISYHNANSIFDRFETRKGVSTEMLGAAPPAIVIRRAKDPRMNWCSIAGNGRFLGLGQPASNLLAVAYGFSQYRIVSEVPLPPDSFDFIATLPAHNSEALQGEIRKKLGLVARRETRDMNVFVLTVQNRNEPGFQPSTSPAANSSWNDTLIRGSGLPVDYVVGILEDNLKTPVIDQSGLGGNFDLQLRRADSNQPDRKDRDTFRQQVLDQWGLQLTPAVQPLEVLVIEKAN